MDRDVLVTIGVITYNSSEFVVETLESIKAQTYKNIELIISDDASTDRTVEVCNAWVSKNEGNINAKVISTKNNTGTAGNCNRILNNCHGEWLKIIAGDDLLMPNAIEQYVNFVRSNDNISHVVANIKCFDDNGDLDIDDDRDLTRYLCREEASVEEQQSVITKLFFGDGPSYLMDFVAVKYRVRNDSVSHTCEGNSLFPSNLVRVIRDYRFLYRKEHSTAFWKVMHYISLTLSSLIIWTGNNKELWACRLSYSIYKILDPYVWFGRYMYFKMNRYNLSK